MKLNLTVSSQKLICFGLVSYLVGKIRCMQHFQNLLISDSHHNFLTFIGCVAFWNIFFFFLEIAHFCNQAKTNKNDEFAQEKMSSALNISWDTSFKIGFVSSINSGTLIGHKQTISFETKSKIANWDFNCLLHKHFVQCHPAGNLDLHDKCSSEILDHLVFKAFLLHHFRLLLLTLTHFE